VIGQVEKYKSEHAYEICNYVIPGGSAGARLSERVSGGEAGVATSPTCGLLPDCRPPVRSASFRCANCAFADDVSWTDRLRYTSQSDDRDFAARRPDEPAYVVQVACENHSSMPQGCRHYNGVNNIRRLGYA